MKKAKEEPKESPKPARVALRNNLSQKLVVNVLNGSGVMESVEILAKGSVSWQKLNNYGPHVASLKAKRLLSVSNEG